MIHAEKKGEETEFEIEGRKRDVVLEWAALTHVIIKQLTPEGATEPLSIEALYDIAMQMATENHED